MTLHRILHHRQTMRLKGYDYSIPGAYFVTIVADNRRCLFGQIIKGAGLEPAPTDQLILSPFGEIVFSTWNNLVNHNRGIELGAYIVMPNHIHGIINITEMDMNVGAGSKPAPELPEIIRQFKTFSARRINELRGTTGTPVWQRNYYDHIIRNSNELALVTDYILDNPRQWCEDPENQ